MFNRGTVHSLSHQSIFCFRETNHTQILYNLVSFCFLAPSRVKPQSLRISESGQMFVRMCETYRCAREHISSLMCLLSNVKDTLTSIKPRWLHDARSELFRTSTWKTQSDKNRVCVYLFLYIYIMCNLCVCTHPKWLNVHYIHMLTEQSEPT